MRPYRAELELCAPMGDAPASMPGGILPVSAGWKPALHDRQDACPTKGLRNSRIVNRGLPVILAAMLRLTKQEQFVLCIVLSLLLVGWTVKAYRASHPSSRSNELSSR